MTNPLPKGDDEYIRTPQGVVSYSYEERVAIMVESGATLEEARAQAAREEQRRAAGGYVPGKR